MLSGQSTKTLLIFGLLVAAGAAVGTWCHNQPDAVIWTLRYCLPVVGVACLVALILIDIRRDQVPDFLAQSTTNYFNCNGMCFMFRVAVIDKVAYMIADFQNQFDGPCRAKISLRPARRLFMDRFPIDTLELPVECPPAGFGSSQLPLAVPLKLQGKNIEFDVAAVVEFPEGKGKRLRFRDGMHLHSCEQTSGIWNVLMFLGGLCAGMVITSSSAKLKAQLPKDVSEIIPEDALESLDIHWKYGDPTSISAESATSQSGEPLTALL